MIHRFQHYSLLPHNTFGIDVKADRFIEYDTVEDIKKIIENGEIAEPFLHIGQGSNLLFAGDFHGTILHSLINSIKVVGETASEIYVKAGSGVVWDDFVAFCVNNGWYGAENLSNIPGEVGASAVQNIGAYGVEAQDIIATVETLNLEGIERTYYPEDCKFAYRYSIFKEPEMKSIFVTGITFRLSKVETYKLDYGTIRRELANYSEINLKNVRQAIINIRSAKLPDPAELGNAGSFFMNPVVDRSKFEKLKTIYPEIPYYELDDKKIKIPAGWLIEKCGWKGRAIGPARVHDKQALVLVNTGGASGKDIMTLCDAVRESVNEIFDIDLHPEVKFIAL